MNTRIYPTAPNPIAPSFANPASVERRFAGVATAERRKAAARPRQPEPAGLSRRELRQLVAEMLG